MGGINLKCLEILKSYLVSESEDKKKTTLDVSDWKLINKTAEVSEWWMLAERFRTRSFLLVVKPKLKSVEVMVYLYGDLQLYGVLKPSAWIKYKQFGVYGTVSLALTSNNATLSQIKKITEFAPIPGKRNFVSQAKRGKCEIFL